MASCKSKVGEINIAATGMMSLHARKEGRRLDESKSEDAIERALSFALAARASSSSNQGSRMTSRALGDFGSHETSRMKKNLIILMNAFDASMIGVSHWTFSEDFLVSSCSSQLYY
jgi:hypothetical protein